ncbi:MAG: pyridoxal phosphate-dependent aminotransferase family protein [Deltaproteobacteria bacterium]|nr:pyridoxal phosphate-dependent aminotransferase family protein [Deltaproteobacteria bacterium]
MGIYPLYQPLDRNDGPTAVIEGKSVIMAGSNNYLCLTIHPEVRKASADAAMEFGTSFTGSRLLNGTHRLHGLLEGQLADFFDKEDSLVFSTGYQVNLGVISALVDENSILFMDKGDHASIYDAARLARGKVVRFDHNDEKALEEAFKQADPALGGQPGLGKIVIVDGVFSMEGNLCRLPEILSVCKKYKARLIVDDAHGVGTVGPGGRGTSHYFGLEKEVDLIIGTFSKTLASIGGFVAGDAKIIHYIKHFGRSIIYSASLPAPNVAAVICALKIMRREPERVERVIANGRTMREGLKSIGLNIGISETPIVPIIIGDELLTLTLWRELLNMGVYVNVAIHPAVPRGKSLLRTSYTSEHTREHLDRVLDIFSSLKKKHNL